MKKLSPEIISALRKAIESLGSQVEFERISGVRQRYITKYLSGKIKRVEGDTWTKLYPHLREFLPADFAEPQIVPISPALPMDQKILIDQYKELAPDEKEALIKELIIKNEVKKMKKTS